MSLILAIRANGKVYFCSDKRVTCGATIERDQTKLVILSSRASGQPVDIVLGVCGDMRMLTILKDPRNQAKLLQHYQEAPTIYGLVDGIKAIVEANGAQVKNQPGGTGNYVLSLVVAIDSDLYEVGTDLTIDLVPLNDLAASGSGALIASAFWAGRTGRAINNQHNVHAFTDAARRAMSPSVVMEEELFNCLCYVASVDSGVGTHVTGHTYDLQVPA